MLGLARAERARRTLERAAVQRREQLTLEQLLAESSPPTYSGVPVTTDTAARHSAVWACWRLLGDTISTLPVDVYRRGTRGAIDPPAWLERPQADADLVDWLYMLVVSLCARGNAYGLVVDRSGATMLPSQIEILHPDRVNVTAPKGQILYRVAGEEIPRRNIWHLRAYRFPGALEGAVAHRLRPADDWAGPGRGEVRRAVVR
jgi:phage portal protein BeeE